MSKQIVLIIAGVVAAIFFGARAEASDQNSDDYLVPGNEIYPPNYRKLIEKKLFDKTASHARITIFPSSRSKGEATLAIYATSSHAAAITRTAAARNLWDAAFIEPGVLEPDVAVEITHMDVPFPRETALLVSKAIKRMLEKIRPDGRFMLHGTLLLVSVEGVSNPSAEGALMPFVHGPGSMALRRLADLLDTYCDAKTAGRPRLIRKIEATARQMLE